MKRRRTTTRVTVDRQRGVFMISVAAELADMHPQTLRMYETRGLIEPQRSPKGTRLYSQADVDRLRRIQEMTNELGLNLAGVERVLVLEEQLERATRRLEDARAPQPRDARGDGGRDRAGAQVVPRRDRPLPRLDRPDPRARRRLRRGTPSACERDAEAARTPRVPTPDSTCGQRERSVATSDGSASPRVVPSSPPACSSAAWRPGCSGGRSCGLISSWASGVSPAGVSLSGIRCALAAARARRTSRRRASRAGR